MVQLVIFHFKRKAATLWTLHKLNFKYHWHLGAFSWRLVGLVGKPPVWSYKEYPGNLKPWANNLCCILGLSSEIIKTSDSSRLTFKGPGVTLYGICDDLYEPSTGVKMIFYLVYHIDSMSSTTYQKEEAKIKSCLTTVIRYVWYVFESRSCIQAQVFP